MGECQWLGLKRICNRLRLAHSFEPAIHVHGNVCARDGLNRVNHVLRACGLVLVRVVKLFERSIEFVSTNLGFDRLVEERSFHVCNV